MSQQTMKAIQVQRYGGPGELRLEEVAQPEPGIGEVLIRVHATGVLPIEWKIRQGAFHDVMPASFPYVPGSAVAGMVEAVGPGVSEFRKGQAVFGRSNKGSYAEYTTAAVENLALKPEALSFDEAATISGGATTAWTALFETAELRVGQSILIHGAAGGVGLFAVQFARWKGARVIGTASKANVDFVRSLGAESVVDYTTTPFEQVAQDVDVVLDSIGGDVLARSLRVVRQGGILVSLLVSPSQEQAQELGIRATKNTASLPYPSTRLLGDIAQLIVEGQVRTVIARTFPLREAGRAHELSQTGHGRGRIVLHIAD
ncbi:NADP-dependent oxidoreductase [Ktedonobacter racemifer]|uniref:Alcohol dehydrogenase zinc-binding domain protein n=1 Tax=Ktedonobacter racemifer DSM 44963 TaxID=485913 RepID=D6U147_KTERA|nr:NADP-dependent oxidoreductase [Ktedonobacter racemifer]EFH82537.1 Alcohol dehydrogenase zinc-binding domain protein [Ktedonobacter racemifer DSM 44963]